MKSEGDYAAASKLMETYGIHFDAKLRDEIVARVRALKLPSYTGFVMLKPTAVTDPSGKITDVNRVVFAGPYEADARVLRRALITTHRTQAPRRSVERL
jgi:hypothetical protein